MNAKRLAAKVHTTPRARQCAVVYLQITIGSYNGSAVFMTRWTIPVRFKFLCVVVVFGGQTRGYDCHETYGQTGTQAATALAYF